MANNSFLNKILLLLEKTKDALIEDLKKEFVSVRTAWDDALKANAYNEKDFSFTDDFNKKVKIIDAVFAKVGYDISHICKVEESGEPQLPKVKEHILSLLSTVDGLTSDVKQLVEDYQNNNDLDGEEVAKALDSIVPHIQTLLTLVKEIADIEWDKVAIELGDTMENVKDQFLTKEFARKVLDHIIITLLKNAKDVFHDEIEFVRMTVVNGVQKVEDNASKLANSIASQIAEGPQQASSVITAQVNALLRETLDEYGSIKQRLEGELNNIGEYIKDAGDDIVNSNIYVKISRAMSITYSILDFLGVIREVKVTLRLPSGLKGLIDEAENLVSNAQNGLESAIGELSETISENAISATTNMEALQANVINGLQTAANKVSEASATVTGMMDEKLQITKEITGLSAAALGTMQTQLLTIYGQINQDGDNISGIFNNFSETLTGTLTNANNEIGKICNNINEGLESIKNISYPVTIVTVSWSSVESLFTQPISHFKNLYPINNVDDIENLMRRLMGIMHCINPDIPDFDSIRNMLESLLKRLQEKVIMLVNKAKDKASKIWEKFQPIIATIRKVIDMLKEMAMALKDRMYGVLNDVKAEMSEVMNGAKQLITDLQDQLKKQAGIFLDKAGDLVDEAGNKIKDAENTLEGKLNHVFTNFDETSTNIVNSFNATIEGGAGQIGGSIGPVEEFDLLTDEVKDWVNKQRESIAKINIPSIVKRTIAEPLIHCASGIIKDTFDLENTPDFVSAYNLLHDIATLPTLLNRQFELKPISVDGNELPTLNFKFSDIASLATNDFNDAWKGINDLVQKQNLNFDLFDLDVKSIVVPQLQAWAYGVTASIKTVVDPKVWQARMDTIIAQLQAEFQNDLQNITSLISKDGVNRLISDAGAVKNQLKNNLQINDYVTIVQTALNDVVLPNPELYFSSLKITLSNIVAQLAAALLDKYEDLKSTFDGKLDNFKNVADNLVKALDALEEEAIETILKQKANLMEWALDVKDKVVDEALKRFNTVKDAVIDIAKRIQELVESCKKFLNENFDTFSPSQDQLKESLKNHLEDLALEIWGNLKSEVINPVLTTIKDEIIRRIRKLVKEAVKEITDALKKVEPEGTVQEALKKVPGIKELKEAINQLANNVENVIRNDSNVRNALKGIEGFDPTNPKITDLKQLPVIFEHLEKANVTIPESFTLEFLPNVDAVIKKLKESDDYLKQSIEDQQRWLLEKIEEKIEEKKKDHKVVSIPAEYICWAQSLLQATIDFTQSDMAAVDILNLAIAVYKGIPNSVKKDISDLMPELPELPDNSFTQMMNKATCTYDLDNKFCNLTLLNLHTKEDENEANLLMQVFAFVGTYNPEEANAEVTVTVKDDDKNNGDETAKEEEDKSKPALYIMFFMKGNFVLKINTENHEFVFNAEGKIGESFEGNKDDKKDGTGNEQSTQQPSNQSLGFCLTKKTDDDPCYFHSWASTDSLSGRIEVDFQRNQEKENNQAKLLSTKYLDLNISNYPQVAYLMYNSEYPTLVTKAFPDDFKEEADKLADGFTFGYMGKLEDMEIILKLRQNEFFKSILKDDISAKFTVSLLYDYLKGFKFGGGYSFHLDYDCSNLKLGKLNLQNLGIDIGSLKNDWGTLQLGIGTSFSINLDAVAFSFEDLGINLDLNIVKPDFSLGDWDFGCKFKFPTGVGISIDATAVKGSGLISYNEATGELIGELELKVINKFGVSAFMLVDLGTVEGHFFSFVGLLSTTFTPGIPLGMGFSLTGIGGCLGLERMIDRKALTTAVRQGTMASIFFVEDLKNHLDEMKSTALALFPAKQNQFFLGLLGQISYEPVLTCNFGLMLQLPSPTEVIIVGSLKVALEDLDVIRINVQFAGGINFEEGIWFDASLIDSQIVGIKLEGDMAFRLFWGGASKGFLLSVGGFHPNYKPEPGMLVSDMKRLAMKLDYDILKIGLETYLAITSNSFQIGAHLDLKIGWNKFGIFGYAGFDALFQFDPFMFMFDVECGVSVKCGSWTLLSIDLAFSLSGPRPWHVSGSAKFWFILIPIEVGFNLEWGDKQPQLPNKQIEVLPILKEQLENLNNWTVETAQTDDDVVVNMKHEEHELLMQPFGTLHFNQSAIPLQLEQPMDLCNNAVPTDYNNLTIKGFKLFDKEITKNEEDNLVNDFAPALYYNLSNQEKLSRPSYEKYVSGFSLSATETNTKGSSVNNQVKVDFYEKDSNVPIEGCTFIENSNASMANRTLAKKDGKPQPKGPNHPLKTKNAFERYIKTLDSIYENN